MFDPLTPLDPLENSCCLFLVARGQGNGDRLADNVAGAIAQDCLGASIPVRHNAIERLPDDSVFRRGDNRRQTAVRLFRGLSPHHVEKNASNLSAMPAKVTGPSAHT
jgi:hypothetical protein